MRRRTSVLLASTAAVATVLVVGASSTAGSGARAPERVTLMSAGPAAAPEALAQPDPAAPDAFTELQKRVKRATADAQKRGADISLTVLDRKTGTLVQVLKERLGEGESLPVLIQADAETPHQAVMKALDAASQAGLARIAFAGTRAAQPDSESDPPSAPPSKAEVEE